MNTSVATPKTKFQPGTFLEVDDLAGGRKVVLVGRDGVTFWDALDTSRVTPMVIHPVFKARELGSLIEFARRSKLEAAARQVAESLRVRLDRRYEDSLFVMRMLWALSASRPEAVAEGWVPDEAAVQAAYEAADAQEKGALQQQQTMERALAAA